MRAVLAIDQGTTGTTCLVLDADGRLIGRAYAEFTQHYPEPGRVEHDADEIWVVTQRVAREALRGAAEKAGRRVEPAAIGITNQRETVVVWDRETGEPVGRAIVWQDRRTTALCRALRAAGHEELVRRRTGLVLDPYFSATKLQWLLEDRPELRQRAEAGELAAGTIDAWLVWKLTAGAVHATDPTNASRTLLYDLLAGDWDDGLLDLFGVPRALLPGIRPSAGSFGTAVGEALGVAAPVAGVAGDQQAALFGQGCVRAGQAKNTYGTGAFLLLHTGRTPVLSSRGLLATAACGPRGEPAFALEGSIFIAGAAVQWLRDGLGIVRTAAETAALAEGLASNEGVYFVPGFVGLGAPHWNPDVRGTIVGLTRGTGRAHVVRAALEAMAYATHDVIETMVADSGVAVDALRVDGGASANDWLMQFQADVIGVPVRRPPLVETTALGAAALAGIGEGIWADADAFLAARGEATVFEPRASRQERDRLLAGWRRAVAAAVAWANGG
jgi:glycerol kinase